MNRFEEIARVKEELHDTCALIREMEHSRVPGKTIHIQRQKARELRKQLKELERIN